MNRLTVIILIACVATAVLIGIIGCGNGNVIAVDTTPPEEVVSLSDIETGNGFISFVIANPNDEQVRVRVMLTPETSGAVFTVDGVAFDGNNSIFLSKAGEAGARRNIVVSGLTNGIEYTVVIITSDANENSKPAVNLPPLTPQQISYVCDNGFPIPDAASEEDLVGCQSCVADYHLDGGAGAGTACEINAYVCENGTTPTDIPAADGEMRCVSCDPGYYLESATECALLDFGNGAFTRVGGAVDFTVEGTVSEERPVGLAAIGDTLYMTGDSNDALYILNTTTGAATRVGSATAFGVGETIPTGLAAIGNTLYMVGSTTDVLYTVDTVSGTATRVGSATAFGVGETFPVGLAAIGNTLYMTGTSTNFLYTVDTVSGTATRVGLTTAFGVAETSPGDIAAIGNTLYMVGSINSTLYTVDTVSGTATRVGSATAFDVGETSPTGLAVIGNTLYMVGFSGRILYTVDTVSGAATRVGSADLFGIGETSPTGLAAIGNTLYMSGDANNVLYTVDTVSGAATRVGSATAFGRRRNQPRGPRRHRRYAVYVGR